MKLFACQVILIILNLSVMLAATKPPNLDSDQKGGTARGNHENFPIYSCTNFEVRQSRTCPTRVQKDHLNQLNRVIQ